MNFVYELFDARGGTGMVGHFDVWDWSDVGDKLKHIIQEAENPGDPTDPHPKIVRVKLDVVL